MENKPVSKLQYYIDLATSGTPGDVENILKDLHADMTFKDSRFIDYSLGLVRSVEGLNVIREYLFKGTQIQRNYCTLFFNRRGDWNIVKKAYLMGLIDEIQTYSK